VSSSTVPGVGLAARTAGPGSASGSGSGSGSGSRHGARPGGPIGRTAAGRTPPDRPLAAPGSVTPALLGGVSVLAGALTLRPLLVGWSWWGYVLVTVGLVVGTGLAMRRLRAPAVVVAAVQVLVAGAWLVVARSAPTLRGGLLPGTATLRDLRAQAEAARELIDAAAPPVVADGGMLLLVGAGLGAVALLVDHLVVTWRVPALAAVPLLAVHVVTMICSPSGVGPVDFAVSAVALLALVLYAPNRSLRGAMSRLGGAGVRIGLLGVGLAVLVPAIVPGVGSGAVYHLGYHAPTGDGDGTGTGGGQVLTVQDPLVQLRRNLTQPQDVNVLTYRTSDGSRPYLRLSTLESFDGQRWSAGPRDLQPASDQVPLPSGLASDVPRTSVTTEATIADGLVSRYLPVPYPVSAVRVDGAWNVDSRDLDVVTSRQRATGGLGYRTTSLALTLTPQRLRAATGDIPGDIRDEDLALPRDLPTEVAATARQVTRTAATGYDRAVALQDWFRAEFTYDVTYREGTSNGALARFLADRRGYCEQFAATMAVMARTLGIPARVVTGFLPGTDDGSGRVTVTARDAHAWPELWFAGSGWVRFEPTPSARVAEPPTYAVPTPVSGSPAPVPSTRAVPAPLRAAPQGTGSAAPVAVTGTGGGGGSGGHDGLVVTLVALGAAVILLAPHLGVALWRRRRRSTARARGGPAGAVEQAWDEVRSASVEAGSRWPAASTPRASARSVLTTVARQRDDGVAPAGVVRATARLVALAERVSYAPPGAPAPDLSGMQDDVTVVVGALRVGGERRTRIAAFMVPEPVRRLRVRSLLR